MDDSLVGGGRKMKGYRPQRKTVAILEQAWGHIESVPCRVSTREYKLAGAPIEEGGKRRGGEMSKELVKREPLSYGGPAISPLLTYAELAEDHF